MYFSPNNMAKDPANFPDVSLDAASNYCRNPDNEPGGPWCYTTSSSKRWEYCGVPLCTEYLLSIMTSSRISAGTDDEVKIDIKGSSGNSITGKVLDNKGKDDFEWGK